VDSPGKSNDMNGEAGFLSAIRMAGRIKHRPAWEANEKARPLFQPTCQK